MEILNKLKDLDAYPKINEDFYNRTLFEGLITIFSSIAMLLLFFSEFRLYLNAVTESKLTVDTSRGETLRINAFSQLLGLLMLSFIMFNVQLRIKRPLESTC